MMNLPWIQSARVRTAGNVVPRVGLLIEYEREDETVGQFAECPTCAAVIQPDVLDEESRSLRQPTDTSTDDNTFVRPGGEADG